MERRILSKRYITTHEARKIIEERLEEGEKTLEIINRTRDYLMVFGKLDVEESRSAVESLLKLGMPIEAAVNIVDLCLQSEGEVRLVLSAFKDVPVDPEVVSNILAVTRRVCLDRSQATLARD
ncbi:MAG: hypothetical protein QXS85_02110 [Acidilobaceae archaeon]